MVVTNLLKISEKNGVIGVRDDNEAPIGVLSNRLFIVAAVDTNGAYSRGVLCFI